MTDKITDQEFYRLRDDRTNRIVGPGDYHKLHVRVVSGSDTVHTFNGQVQLLVVANLLARWCRQMEFGFPDVALADPLKRAGIYMLQERIAAEIADADPYCKFNFLAEASPDCVYTLKVGEAILSSENVDFTIDADSWCAYGGRGNTLFGITSRLNNPAAAAFAACIGIADAFKAALNLPDHMRVRQVAFSLLDFSTTTHSQPQKNSSPPQTIELGKTQMVGVGSIGSAVVYLLRMLPVRGTLELIDADKVKIENLNRSPLFTVSDIGQCKVHAAGEYLRDAVSTSEFPILYDEYISGCGRQNIDLVLPLANEFGVRHGIENNFPPLQIYGTTTTDWGVNYHRHIPLKEDCACCRFPDEVGSAHLVCSEAKIEPSPGEQIDAALPFVSVAAAALTVADLLKLQLSGYPYTPNFIFIDFKGSLDIQLPYDKPQRETCTCKSRSRAIHTKYIEGTRFSKLSLNGH